MLITQFSGIPTALAAAQATEKAQAPAQAPTEADLLQGEGNKISGLLSRLLFEARNPNTLSAGPSKPALLKSRSEAAQTSLMAFKARLEAYLASPDAVGGEEGSEGSAVTFYFEQAIKAVQLRALTAEGGKVDFAKYDFRIPYRMLERMSGFAEAATSELVLGALADPNSMVALDRDSVRSANGDLAPDHPVKLQIGRAFAERFVLVARGGMSDERAFITVVKSFAVTALLDQWEQIELVRKVPAHDLPAIPPALASELGVLGRPAETRAQRDLLASEPERRGAIVNGYRQWWFENDKKDVKADLTTLSEPEQTRLRQAVAASRAAGLEFTNEAFFQGYLAVTGAMPDTDLRSETTISLFDAMRLSESAYIRVGLSQAMLGYPLPLAGMSSVELRRALRKILAQAKFIAILPVLQKLPTPEGKDTEIDAFLTRSLDAFGARISDRVLDLWIAASESNPDAARLQAHREYVQDILKQAVSLDHDPKAGVSPDADADFELVKRVGRMTPEYRSLRDSIRGDLELILKPKDWHVSTSAYRLLLSKIAEREAAARAAKDVGKTQAYVEESKGLREAAPHFGLKESGVPAPKLTLGELSEADRAAYLGLSDSTKLNNSLLTVELEKKKPLYQQLAALMKSSPETAFAPAEALLERAFDVLRANIRADFDQLGRISGKDPKEQVKGLLPLIARSTLLKIQIPKAFPMLNEQLDGAVDAYLSGIHDRGIFAEAKEAFMKPMNGLMFLFVAKLALMIFRPTRPFARAVTALEVGIGVETQGYMIAALPLMVADAGLDYAEYREARHDELETRQWFSTSAEASSFYDYYSVADSETRTNAAWTQFSSSVEQQLLFIGVPVLAGLAKPALTRAFDGWKVKKFERLGFGRPDVEAPVSVSGAGNVTQGAAPFTWNTQEIQNHARAKLEELKSQPATPERFAREKQIQADADSLVKFIQKQEKTARLMMKDFEREYRALGIPAGKETLNLRRLIEAKSILEARYRSYEIGLEELEKGRKAFEEITRGVQAVWGGNVSPIRTLFYKLKGKEVPRGPKEAFRERLYAEVYGFTDYGPHDSWFGNSGPLKDYYLTLGLNASKVRAMPGQAAEDEIKLAYRRAARASHPDVHQNDPHAEDRFKAANEAYQVLSDPIKRANYDAFLDRARGPKGKEPRS